MRFLDNMEKRCQNCKYKVYKQLDTKEAQSFYACKDKLYAI